MRMGFFGKWAGDRPFLFINILFIVRSIYLKPRCHFLSLERKKVTKESSRKKDMLSLVMFLFVFANLLCRFAALLSHLQLS